ncbi:MAG: ATP-binding protein [Acidobacteriota bacterium]
MVSTTTSDHADSTDLSTRRWWQRERWRYAAAGFLLGAVESLVAMLLGLEIRLGERDVSLFVFTFVELSFAAFGYLIGALIEARRGEHVAARQAHRRLETLSDLRARLAHSEKLASLGQLAGTVAHEIRNPLGILRSMAQNLDEELDARGESRLGESGLGEARVSRDMIEEIDRLSNVTARLLDFSAPIRPVSTHHRIDDLAKRTIWLMTSSPRNPDVRMTTTGDPELELYGDSDLLCQLLLGLLDNAIDASPAGGTVTLGWAATRRNDQPGSEVWVSDQGEGVPEAIRDRIFEAFFTTRHMGHGLGLAVAKHIADAHGAELSVGTDPDTHGARFTLFLPEPA